MAEPEVFLRPKFCIVDPKVSTIKISLGAWCSRQTSAAE